LNAKLVIRPDQVGSPAGWFYTSKKNSKLYKIKILNVVIKQKCSKDVALS